MFKSHVEELIRVYECLFQDISYAYPTLQGEFERDLAHLKNLVRSRGIHILCVDLPAAGKHLDRCLSEGFYTCSGLPLTKRCPRTVAIPEFLRGLYLEVFDENGRLKEDCNVDAILFLRQLFGCAKKASIPCSDRAVADEVREFYQLDCSLPEPEQFWYEDNPPSEVIERTYHGYSAGAQASFASQGERSMYLKMAYGIAQWLSSHKSFETAGAQYLVSSFVRNLDHIQGLLAATLGPYRPDEWSFKHGPGAIAERTGSVNKYQFVNWSRGLESVFPIADFGFHNHAAWGRWVASGGSSIEGFNPHSRLVAVPKTLKRPRLIAAEPSEHQWCQQNLWHYFRTQVARTWIGSFVNFHDQNLNQELCLRGSKDGSMATLDLSSASDRVTCHHVGQLFRTNLNVLQALRASRTRCLSQTIVTSVPAVLRLKKFSTMGSACTFPVESLMFLTVALAAVLTQRRWPVAVKSISRLIGEVAVFGDDLIVPTESWEFVSTCLEALGFQVNSLKSFGTGMFRESCGVDAFRGIEVTPAYWRAPVTSDPESVVSKLAVRNNFYMKGFWKTAEYLTSTLPSRAIPRVSIDSGVCGLKSFLGANCTGQKTRYNSDLQREEVRMLKLRSKSSRAPITDDSAFLQFFTENPEPFSQWQSGTAQRPKHRLALAWEAVEHLGS